MMIPHRMLSPEALRGVIEAFITREGTDYGQTVPRLTLLVNAISTSENRRPFSEKHYTV
jgi:uncharacterized protein